MKILHLCLANYYIDNYAYQENMLSKYHKMAGHDVTIIASLQSFDKNGVVCYLEKPSKYINEYGIPVYRIDYKYPFKKINRIIRRYESWYWYLEDIKPDIIFIHECQFWDIKFIVKYFKKNPNVKIFTDNHSDFINSGRNWLSRNVLHKILWRYCAKKIEPYVEKFWGVTPLRCDFLNKVYKIDNNKIDLLIMGIDDEKINFRDQHLIRSNIRSTLGIFQNNFVIITGGKIERRKNTHLLMRAISQINRDNIKLIVFGTPTSEIKNEVEQLSRDKHIINIGWLDSDKVYDYFLASDLAVFPGTHSVLWEQAAGCGLPCVLKYWEGMNHVNIDGNCKFLFEDSVEELKKVLLTIIDDSNIYNQLKDSAEEGKEYFSYKQIALRSILSE